METDGVCFWVNHGSLGRLTVAGGRAPGEEAHVQQWLRAKASDSSPNREERHLTPPLPEGRLSKFGQRSLTFHVTLGFLLNL